MTDAKSFQNNKVELIDTTILSGQTDSDAINLSGTTIAGVFTPAAFTGTTLQFKASPDEGATFVDVNDATGAPIAITVAPSKYTPISPQQFYGLRLIKIVSGSAEAADRIIKVVPYPI